MPRQSKATSAAAASRQTPVLALAALCNDAAERVAKARLSLFEEGAAPDIAMAHLDDAIGCLQALLAESKTILDANETVHGAGAERHRA